ncbi:SPOR domain-containing protein [Modicisalibacter luteus]|uniref:SPOR domain-containing protein n=1 Tax=Modicisalibacter luteus TaxID=453962 RepID=A0ABV7M169_9GAMM|nr:SPOR domain-containing protein [Halomonas lutea]GHA92749.1 cell division protein [Halomonas lutea]
MKYGMRERISGAVILVALGVIFIPMLFDEPPSREEQPEPVLTIQQPIEVERVPVAEPERPSSLGQIQMPSTSNNETQQANTQPKPTPPPPAAPDAEPAAPAKPTEQPVANPSTRSDPIADLARQSEQRQGESETQASSDTASSGEWAVQVGSFGEPDNAQRLESKLDEQGFNAFRQPRSNNLTTVYVGPFASSEAGEQARTELKEKANIQGLLVRMKEDE